MEENKIGLIITPVQIPKQPQNQDFLSWLFKKLFG